MGEAANSTKYTRLLVMAGAATAAGIGLEALPCEGLPVLVSVAAAQGADASTSAARVLWLLAVVVWLWTSVWSLGVAPLLVGDPVAGALPWLLAGPPPAS